jgi:nucleoside 2-deoxyribosyltransferase
MINVHLIASKSNVIENVQNLRSIVSTVTNQGHKIVYNWVEPAYEARIEHKNEPTDWAEIYATNLETIAKADVIIAETSFNSFGVGYQVAIAVQQKKPTLLLRHESAETDAFATGVVDTWVQKSTYNESSLEDTVQTFLKENDITVKDMRFNFFIDRTIYNHLRWTALKTGKTKAEILRELVKNEIDKKE